MQKIEILVDFGGPRKSSKVMGFYTIFGRFLVTFWTLPGGDRETMIFTESGTPTGWGSRIVRGRWWDPSGRGPAEVAAATTAARDGSELDGARSVSSSRPRVTRHNSLRSVCRVTLESDDEASVSEKNGRFGDFSPTPKVMGFYTIFDRFLMDF